MVGFLRVISSEGKKEGERREMKGDRDGETKTEGKWRCSKLTDDGRCGGKRR